MTAVPADPDATHPWQQLSQLSAIYSYSFKKLSLCLHAPPGAAEDRVADEGDAARCVRVTQPNVVSIESADGRLRSVALDGLRLEPITCSGLRRQRDSDGGVELSLSAAADDDDDGSGDGDTDIDSAADSVRIAALIRDARWLLCGYCRARIADLARFADVKAAPADSAAEGLHEAAAAYFCHVDHVDERKLPPGDARPLTECRYDGVDLILPVTAVVPGAVDRGGRGLAVCARCRAPVGLGRSPASAATFFPGLVSVLRDLRDADDDIVGEEATPLAGDDAESVGHLRRLLRRLGEGDAVRRVSLLAVSDAGAREVALLWRLDGRCRVFSVDVTADENAAAAVCRGRRACRLLYLPFTDPAFAGILATWSRDVSVGSVCLPEELAMRALLLLAESTGQLAPSFRRVHGFFCGFVPYED